MAGPEDGFELEVIVLLFSFGLFGLVGNGDGFILVDTAKVPAICISFSNSFSRNEGFSFVEGVALAKSTINGCLFRAVCKDNGLAIACNLVVLIFISIYVLEYLFYMKNTLEKDYLNILYLNSSCMTTKPPEVTKRSLIYEKPISLQVKMKISKMIFLAMTLLVKES